MAGVVSAAGMSVSGHVENHSGSQVGITEANVPPTRGFPDPRDPRWVMCLSSLSQAILLQEITEKLTEKLSAKVLQDVTCQMKQDTTKQVKLDEVEIVDLSSDEESHNKEK